MNDQLPVAEKTEVELGYVRLTDAAPFVIARELGYFEQLGLNVALRQEVSWANIRDKLVTGALDGAHMLAPLPAMTTLGVSGLRAPLVASMVLSRNGNAITLSADVAAEALLTDHGEGDRLISSSLLGDIIATSGLRPTLAVVHGFSTHNLMLRRWLQRGGLNPDADVSIIVVPPAQVVDSLRSGVIDGFCAGAPWGTIAALEGVGVTVATGIDVWQNAFEKVFCVSERWHDAHPATHARLRLALLQACEWLADMANRKECAEILAMPCYLDLPVEALLPSLVGKMPLGAAQTLQTISNFHSFKAETPDQQQFVALISESLEMAGIDVTTDKIQSIARQTAREDLFQETLSCHQSLQTQLN